MTDKILTALIEADKFFSGPGKWSKLEYDSEYKPGSTCVGLSLGHSARNCRSLAWFTNYMGFGYRIDKVYDWNDDPNTTFEDIKKAFKDAIAERKRQVRWYPAWYRRWFLYGD